MKEPKPLLQFKVYPGQYSNKHNSKRGLFFWVLVYGSRSDMHKKVGRDGFEACCVSSSNHVNEIGTLVFYRDALGGRIVSHECVHAALTYLFESKRLNKFIDGLIEGSAGGWNFKQEGSSVDESEEVFCYAVGDMVGQIYSKLYAEGMLE